MKQLCVYREKQLASLKTCKLLSKKSALYCTHMDVDDLLKRFRSGTGKALDNDRILLS